MRRRAFLSIAAGAAALQPTAGAGQTRVRTVGVLDSGQGPFLGELRKTLSGLGYREGALRLEVRTADDPESLRRHAEELVGLKVDVIVARLTPALRAAMNATKIIPIVMTACGGPVESGLIASLARPGGNVTGMSLGGMNIVGKRLELIREVMPSVRHIAMVASGDDPFTTVIMNATEQKGRDLGIKVTTMPLVGLQQIEAKFVALGRDRPEAIHAMTNLPAEPLIAFAFKHRIPMFPAQRTAVERGALLSYSGPA